MVSRAAKTIEAVMQTRLALLRLRRRNRRCETTAPSRPRLRSVRRGRTADGGRCLPHHAGIDLLDDADRRTANGDRDRFATRARRGGIDVTAEDDWSDIFSKILARGDRAAGWGMERPHASHRISALRGGAGAAKPRDPRAGRTVRALCLRRGTGQWLWRTDRSGRAARPLRTPKWTKKQRVYGERYPLDEDFLAALAHMPPASGVALGFDRLVMLATGAPQIDDVLWTPLPLIIRLASVRGRFAGCGVAKFLLHGIFPPP